MLLELLTLAQSAPVQPVDHEFLGKFIAAALVTGTLGTVFGVQIGKRKVTVDPQPLSVKMEDHFVTRREFDTFKIEIRGDVAEMKGLFRETMAKIDERDERLVEKIETYATKGVDGRVAIWNQIRDDKKEVAGELKQQGERIAKVEAGVDIAGRFERVAAEALKKPTNSRG